MHATGLPRRAATGNLQAHQTECRHIQPRIEAHRGDSTHSPENTLAACRRAVGLDTLCTNRPAAMLAAAAG